MGLMQRLTRGTLPLVFVLLLLATAMETLLWIPYVLLDAGIESYCQEIQFLLYKPDHLV